MHKFFNRIPLNFINYVFWLLMMYLIAALTWWYIELDQQNDQMLAFQLAQSMNDSALAPGAIEALHDAHERNAKQYHHVGCLFCLHCGAPSNPLSLAAKKLHDGGDP